MVHINRPHWIFALTIDRGMSVLKAPKRGTLVKSMLLVSGFEGSKGLKEGITTPWQLFEREASFLDKLGFWALLATYAAS
jgi:hypothetical protein